MERSNFQIPLPGHATRDDAPIARGARRIAPRVAAAAAAAAKTAGGCCVARRGGRGELPGYLGLCRSRLNIGKATTRLGRLI